MAALNRYGLGVIMLPIFLAALVVLLIVRGDPYVTITRGEPGDDFIKLRDKAIEAYIAKCPSKMTCQRAESNVPSRCSMSKMRTLYKGPVKPPPPGEDFDTRHWLKSAMPNREDRCSGIREERAEYLIPESLGLEDRTILDDRISASTIHTVECLNPEPLGLEGRTIPDDRISASTVHKGLIITYYASSGRLNNDMYWSASSNDNSWIKVDLIESTVVSGVITQGSGDRYSWHVTKYKVAYKQSTSSDYDHVVDANGDIKVFDGNLDDDTTPVTNMFHQSILATVVRIEPVAWVNGVAMRLELLGCRLN